MSWRTRHHRRTSRDEEGGLLFRWRTPGGSLGRTILAVILTTLLFAVVASAFRVRGHAVHTVNRETAHVVILSPDSDEGQQWLAWARQNSPFPDQWEVEVDDVLRQHVAFFDAELEHQAGYRPLLRPMNQPERSFDLPDLFDPAAPRLPPVPRPAPVAGPPPHLESEVVATAMGDLAERWGTATWPLEELLAAIEDERAPANPVELLGLQRRFLVTVSPAGEVVFCQLLNEVESVLDGVLAARLRRHRLAPVADGASVVGGYVRVAVRGVNIEQEGVEERP